MNMLTSGNSGALLTLNNGVVRKKSCSKEYNKRLKAQYEKQLSYKGVFKTPKIIDKGFDDDLFYFDMEYIDGITLSEYMLKSSEKIDKYFSFIKENLLSQTQDKTYDIYEFEKITNNKLEEIKTKLIERNLFDRCEKLWNTFRYEIDLLVCPVSSSYCHGDLTTSNIIITKNDELCLIDFLDSYVDSYLFDYASLMQSLWAKWDFRDINFSKLLSDNIYIAQNALNYDSLDVVTKYTIKVLYAIKLFRALPYSNINDIDFILIKLKEIMPDLL